MVVQYAFVCIAILNLVIFSRDEAKRTGLQQEKQSSSFVDACRARGRKCQEPRGHLGRVQINLTTSGGMQKLFAVVAHHQDVCR